MTFILPVDDILNFWFGDATKSADALKKQAPLWYSGGKDVDLEIRDRFGALFIPASDYYSGRSRGSSTWREASCRELLAAIILFDQFSRNCFRRTARAFAFDRFAINILDVALQQKCPECLHPIECIFLYMPLQHSEDLVRQHQGVAVFEELLERTTAPFVEQVRGSLRHALLHREIIETFGRFPHRNKVLLRQATGAETEYLNDGGKRFGQ